MRVIGFICFILLCNELFAQTYFSQTEFNLGEIAQLNQDVVDINLSNQREDEVYILRVDAPSRISIKYTSKTLRVGSAELLRIKLNPSKTGKFREQIKVYLSSNIQPINLVFKGVVKSIPKNNKTACPDFSGGQKAQVNYQLFKQQQEGKNNYFFVEVFDKEQFVDKKEVDQVETTRKDQQAEIIRPRNKRDKIRKSPEERRNSPSALEILFGNTESDTIEIEVKEVVERQKMEGNKNEIIEENPNELGEEFKPNNVVFLIDASTSMREEERMEILKLSMIKLLEPLRSIDYLSIVTYSGEAQVLLDPTQANQKEEIQKVIENIIADGSTHAAKGIKKAIHIGESNFIEGGNNQIILATDGAFEIGKKNESLRRKIRNTAKDGLTVSVIGIKNANWTKKSLKEIVELGEGNYIKINNKNEASKVLEEVKKRSKK